MTALTIAVGLVAGAAYAILHTQGQARAGLREQLQRRAVLAGQFTTQAIMSGNQEAAGKLYFGGAPDGLNSEIQEYQGKQPAPRVIVLDAQGRLLGADPAAVANDLGLLEHNPAFGAALRGKSSLSDVFSAPNGDRVFDYAVPYRTRHGLRVLAIAAPIADLQAAIGGYMTNAAGVTGAHTYLIDSHERVLAGPEGTREGDLLKDRSLLTALSTGRSGTVGDRTFVSSRAGSTPWRVVAVAPTSALYASVDGTTRWAAWGLLAALAVAVIALLALAATALYRSARLAQERERFQIERQLSSKLESVGQLAAGIAHEINTPIQYVSDSLRFLDGAFGDLSQLQDAYGTLRDAAARGDVDAQILARVSDSEEDADLEYLREHVPAALERSRDGLARVATIVAAMREFGHPPTTGTAPVNINAAIENTLAVAANEYREVAEITTDLGDIPPVLSNGGDLTQVLINLIVNASHAIADTVAITGQRGAIHIETRADDRHVIVTIADTGGGIDAEISERVFDPFFTTKDVGRGTGQGLAIARTIIGRHGGRLTFQTRPGEGTTFTIQLPLSPPAENGVSERAGAGSSAGGSPVVA